MPRNLEDIIRAGAQRWIGERSVEEIVTFLPADFLKQPVALPTNQQPRRGTTPASPPRRARAAKKRRGLTAEISREIRARLKGVRPGTPDYKRARDALCAKFSITPRQVFGAARGWRNLARARRKKR